MFFVVTLPCADYILTWSFCRNMDWLSPPARWLYFAVQTALSRRFLHFSQISGTAVIQIPAAALIQCQKILLLDCQFFHLFLLKTIRHIIRENPKIMCLTLFSVKRCLKDVVFLFQTICKDAKKSLKSRKKSNYLQASSIATAQATVIPTIGLLPAPMRPIIST